MKFKTILGIILILLSIAAMFFWESTGRDMMTTTSILVCSEPVKKGNTVEMSDFKTIRVQNNCIINEALTPEYADTLVGKTATIDLIENQQLLASYFTESGNSGKNNQSIYVIPKEWIFSRSSALRSGDTVSIYKMPEKEKLGTYTVAFVRDANEQEVTDIEPGARGVLDRKDSGRMISGIEIICTLDDYSKLYKSVCYENSEDLKESNGEEEKGDAEAYAKVSNIEILANLLVVMEGVI